MGIFLYLRDLNHGRIAVEHSSKKGASMSRLFAFGAIFLALSGCTKPEPQKDRGTIRVSAVTASTKPFNLQEEINNSEWSWEPEEACLFHCAFKEFWNFRTEIVIPKREGFRNKLLVRLFEDGKEIYSFEAYRSTVFTRQGDILYLADFCPVSSGCSILAIDFRAKKQLWKAELRGIGPVSHSKYFNQVTVHLVANDLLLVRGNEAFGRYLEFVNIKTGKTVGNKVFRDHTGSW